MSARVGAGGACCCIALALAAVGSARTQPALADTCPNAQFRSGPSQRLPNCRAYEQVSPTDKGGLDAVTLESMQPAQSSACEAGETCTIEYMSLAAAFAGSPGDELGDAYLGTSSGGGWQTTPLAPPSPQAPPNSFPLVSYAFSEDLTEAVLRVPLQPLTGGVPAGVYNLFTRGPAGGYSLVTSSAPPEPPASGCGECFESEDVPAFAGASRDFSRVLFEANYGVEGAPNGTYKGRRIENLYESSDGSVRPVGFLPDGAIAAHGESVGGGLSALGNADEVAHAISEDGSQILFTAEADGGGPDPAQKERAELYDRLDGSSTFEISAPAPGARPGECDTRAGSCDPAAARYWAASADGSVVYFTSKAALTKDSYTGPEESAATEDPGNDLYRYDLDTHTLSDLTAEAPSAEDPDGARVLGVVGASEDGSYVYFVADGHLAEGTPSGEDPHLYVWHETAEGSGTVSFIASLHPPDEAEQEDIEEQVTGSFFPYHSDILDWSDDPDASQAYVTPDGGHLAFMSVEPLTGYQNRSRNPAVEGGDPVHEVFEYSAEDSQLTCASCDPNGAEPFGSAFIGAGLAERASTPFHQPRSLSDDGRRLFFTSPDPLVPGLAGGTDKLFEYENGAILPISGAEGGTSATFLDASASGDDVFFATRERLVSSDTDELLDVYDARVDGGFPAPASSCASCSSSPYAPPLLPTPLSTSPGDYGNLHSQAPAKPSRARLLARALASCRRLKDHRKRALCVRRAERRYAPKASKTTRLVRSRHRAAPK
jgi:hypothetical protein